MTLVSEAKPAQCDALSQALTGGSVSERREAVVGLAEFGDLSVAPLCRALEDRDIEVRRLAAKALVELGDERAVGPLTRALRKCLLGGSGRRHRAYTIALTILTQPSLFFIFHPRGAKMSGLLFLYVLFWTAVAVTAQVVISRSKKAKSELWREIIRALDAIGERKPSPELITVVPDIKAVAADHQMADEAVRKMAKKAAQRIETATAHLKDVPLPSSAPAPDATTLPRAAGPREEDSVQLPRVSG